MFELIQALGNSYYFRSPAKAGLYRLGDTECCLIDSGSDKDAGRKIRAELTRQGWALRAVYNTHSNADHIGGNAFLQARTGCRVYAPGAECGFTNHTFLEPSLLFGGFPPRKLRHKFLVAEPSVCEPLTPEALPEGFELLPLPGHFLDMAGFRTPDDVVYLADCLFSRETFDKYGLGFIYDVGAYLATLDYVEGLSAALFIPSHLEPTDDVRPLARENRECVLSAAEQIVGFCAEPVGTDGVMKRLFLEKGLEMSFEQYALVGSTVRSYLAWLHDAGRLEVVCRDGELLWVRA